MSGVRYAEEYQVLQAVNSPKGNHPMKVKPTSGRFTSSRFQNAVYLSIFGGSFPKGALDIDILSAWTGLFQFRLILKLVKALGIRAVDVRLLVTGQDLDGGDSHHAKVSSRQGADRPVRANYGVLCFKALGDHSQERYKCLAFPMGSAGFSHYP